MVNSWSLLYDTMYGPEDEKNYVEWNKIYSGEDKDYEITADGFVWPKSNDISSTVNFSETVDFSKNPPKYESQYGFTAFNPNPISSMSEDKIEFNIGNSNGFWKYEEDKTLKEIEQYLSSTYHSHYTSETSKTQTLDLIESIGDAEAFTRSNAIKYLSRFGKKNGKSKMDILKAIHYCILLYHFAGLHKNTKSDFPY